MPGSNPLRNYCQNALKKYSGQNRVTCQVCTASLARAVGSTLEHTRAHLGKEIFGCKFCDYKGGTLSKMRSHLAAAHDTNASSRHFDDHSQDYFADLIKMFNRCFDSKKKSSLPTGNIRLKSAKRERPKLEKKSAGVCGAGEQK